MTFRLLSRARPASRHVPALRGAAAGLLAAVAGLAGCGSSPPVRYYTLMTPPAASAGPAGAGASDAGYALEVLPVSVPAQVDQPQLMLRGEGGQLQAQYSDRWSAPLPDELRDALSDALTRRLGVPDVRGVLPLPGTPVWRVRVDVQRFEVAAAGEAVLEATWRVSPHDMRTQAAALLCRTRIDIPVRGVVGAGKDDAAAGVDAGTAAGQAVLAQQRAVVLLGDTVASAIRAQGRQAEPASEQVILLGCTRSQG